MENECTFPPHFIMYIINHIFILFHLSIVSQFILEWNYKSVLYKVLRMKFWKLLRKSTLESAVFHLIQYVKSSVIVRGMRTASLNNGVYISVVLTWISIVLRRLQRLSFLLFLWKNFRETSILWLIRDTSVRSFLMMLPPSYFFAGFSQLFSNR